MGHCAEHAEPPGPGDRRDHVAAVAEGEDRELDPGHVADPGPHGSLLPLMRQAVVGVVATSRARRAMSRIQDRSFATVQQHRYSVAMTDQLVCSPEELLASHDYEEPLVVDGKRYHGGFTSDGAYVSPRTLHRWPAIGAWQRRLRAETEMGLIDCPPDLFAEFDPNLDQTRYLIADFHDLETPDPVVDDKADPRTAAPSYG
jgi:hypothetical protein